MNQAKFYTLDTRTVSSQPLLWWISRTVFYDALVQNRIETVPTSSSNHQPKLKQKNHNNSIRCRLCAGWWIRTRQHISAFFFSNLPRRCTKARSWIMPSACATIRTSCSGMSTGAATSTSLTPPAAPSPWCAMRGHPSLRSACTTRSSSKVPPPPHL